MAHKHATASSEDLRSALEKSSGKNLKDFFARWIYGTGHPHYEVNWKWKKGELQFIVRQLQPEAAFPNPLPIEIATVTGKQTVTILPKTKETVETFRISSEPVSIEIDPNNTILKEISLRSPNQQLQPRRFQFDTATASAYFSKVLSQQMAQPIHENTRNNTKLNRH